MKIHRTSSFVLSLITLTFFLSSQILIPNFADASNFAKTKIKHSPIEYFIPGKRIKIQTQIKNPKGIKLARCYFKAEGEANFVFVTMDAMGKSKFHGILPAPSNSTKTIEYLFLAVTNENQIVKTQTFKSHFKQQEIPPKWQTVSAKKELTVSTELPKVPSEIKGFSDSIVMDVAESSARFGIVAGGLYTSISAISSSGTAAASGTAASAAATTTSVAATSTGLSTMGIVGTTIAGAAAITAGAIAANDSGSSDSGSPSSGTENNTPNLINVSGTWQYSASKSSCPNTATGTTNFSINGNSCTASITGQNLLSNCSTPSLSCSGSDGIPRNPMSRSEFQAAFNAWGCIEHNWEVTEFTNSKIKLRSTNSDYNMILTR